MRRIATTTWRIGLLVCLTGFIAGCDPSGVDSIVGGALRLAFGIVDVAT
jgi:hypothetical protein